MSTVEVPFAIEAEVAAMVEATVIADFIPTAEAAEIPDSRNPIAICHVTGCPDISGARARRNIGYRSAHSISEFGCLRRCCSETGRSSHYCCT
jgi:hypothetical protein